MNWNARYDRCKRRLSGLIGRVAANRTAVVVLLLALSLGGRLLLLPWVPIPKPAIQDEFSYLLAGDTYASGRLTNPPHPLWIHFETVHEIMRPTYQSKFFPVQGLLLALGQRVFGHPWFGVWLSMGALSVAIYWALAGWLPPRWALLGGLLALTRVGFLNYWSESYWGGAAAAAAGALVIGSVPRLRTGPRFGIAVTMGIGLALLANSRPFEGAALGAVCLGAVLMKVHPRKLAGPLALILIPTFLWMGYYNFRVAGNPLLLPYQLHEQQYSTSTQFFWDTHFRPAPHYNHDAMRQAWVGWAQGQRVAEHAHPWITRLLNAIQLDGFYLRFTLTCCVAIFALPILLYQSKLRVALILFLIFAACLELETSLIPHYTAPGAAFVFILVAASLRRLWHVSPPVMALVVAVALYFNYRAMIAPENRWLYDKRDFIAQRSSVLQELEKAPGKQLVLVKYGPGHDINHEWVYNAADIDRSRIVWAREMGMGKDTELLDYYRYRKAWRLLDGEGKVTLSPFSPAAGE